MDDEEMLLELSDTLQSDQLIKIYIQEQIKPYLVQEAILTSLSEYFVRALKHENSLGGEKGVLRFPEDDQRAWQVLLHWKFKGGLVTGNAADTQSAMRCLIQCWVLGDKYGIKEFQDLIMLHLLAEADEDYVTVELVKLAFENTPIGSPLRKLMAEELCLLMGSSSKEYKHEDLEVLDGISGFTTALMHVIDHRDSKDKPIGGNKLLQGRWKQYMLEDGPKKHWVQNGD